MSESEVASVTFLFIRLTRAKLLSGTNDGSTFKSTNFTARWSWKLTMKCGKSGRGKKNSLEAEGAVVTSPPQLLTFCFPPLNKERREGQKGYWLCSLIFFQELPHVTRFPPRHQGCLAVFSLSMRSQNVKLVELTRSDREILHVWPGCLSKFGILLVVWGECWKLLEFWTKPSIQRLLVSCWGNPSIKHEEIWAGRMRLFCAEPT